MNSVLQKRLMSLSSQFRSRHSKTAATSRNIFSNITKATFSTEMQQFPFNRFNTGYCVNPHPEKRDKGGEDALALSPNFIALADGVGGWAD